MFEKCNSVFDANIDTSCTEKAQKKIILVVDEDKFMSIPEEKILLYYCYSV